MADELIFHYSNKKVLITQHLVLNGHSTKSQLAQIKLGWFTRFAIFTLWLTMTRLLRLGRFIVRLIITKAG
jgi:hypothetical protein